MNIETLKKLVLGNETLQSLWSRYRCQQLHSSYRARRDHYRRQAEAGKLIYSEAAVTEMIRARLRARGCNIRAKKPGEIHTFAFVPNAGWHKHLLPDLRELGPLTVFDYTKFGYDVGAIHYCDARAIAQRKDFNEKMLIELRETQARQPIDWVYVYASGVEISASTIRAITEEFGLPTVNMCLDDKQSWEGPFMGDHRAGQIDIADCFDLSWTSARVACEWYLVEGGRPIYLPEGFDASAFRPLGIEPDITVSFIGAAYGYRPQLARYLKNHGIDLTLFGAGWPNSGWANDIVEVFNRSRINFGMGGIGYSDALTNVKGRDFEVPGTGGGLYLTTFNPDLAQHFVIGQEIVCYHSWEEALELVRYYSDHPNEASEIAQRAYIRSLHEHRWLHRYRKICQILGLIEEK